MAATEVREKLLSNLASVDALNPTYPEGFDLMASVFDVNSFSPVRVLFMKLAPL